MKVWRTHAAEHSASVKIVGRFASPADAQAAVRMFNDLLSIGTRLESGSAGAVEELESFRTASGLQLLSESDLVELRQFEPIAAGGREIRVETEAQHADALLKIVALFDAQVQVHRREGDWPPPGAHGSSAGSGA